MTEDEFKEQVTIFIVPEPGHGHHEKGGLNAQDTTFLIRTSGMVELDLFELEFIHVPIMGVYEACKQLNHWGHYIADEQGCIHPGENIQVNIGNMPVFLTTEVSDSEWVPKDDVVIRITPGAIMFQCGGNHDGDTVH